MLWRLLIVMKGVLYKLFIRVLVSFFDWGFISPSNAYWMCFFRTIYQFMLFDSFKYQWWWWMHACLVSWNTLSTSHVCFNEYVKLNEHPSIMHSPVPFHSLFKLCLIGYVLAHSSLHTHMLTQKPSLSDCQHSWQMLEEWMTPLAICYSSAVYCIHRATVHTQPQVYGTMTHIIVYSTILCNLFWLSTWLHARSRTWYTGETNHTSHTLGMYFGDGELKSCKVYERIKQAANRNKLVTRVRSFLLKLKR